MRELITAIWTARKPYVDDDGEVYSRRDVWAMARPYWTHTALTTHEACGCRRRFGLWRTIYCRNHAFGPLICGAK